MRKRFLRTMAWICVAAAMSVGVYGCGNTSEEPVEAERAEEDGFLEEEEEPEVREPEGEREEPEKLPAEEMTGDIQDIREGSFRMAKYLEETLEDGSEMMVSPADGAPQQELVTVIYDDDTLFQKRIIRDGGADVEELEASSADLSLDVMVTVSGAWQEDGFYASEVILEEFEH